MTGVKKGIGAMLIASLLWGVSGLYWHGLSRVDASDVLAHRTLWSFVMFLIVFAVTGRLGEFAALWRHPQIPRMTVAAIAVTANWGVFIWGVQNGFGVEAALGYYILPLMSVLAGVVMFRERLWPSQWFAVGLGALAVAVLASGLGVVPWVGLGVAATACAYGILKKGIDVGPQMSVAFEVAIVSPIALLWLGAKAVGLRSGAPLFGENLHDIVLILGSGLITGLPMIFFSYALRRVDLTSIGLMQYLNPTIQLAVAVALIGEPLTRPHLIATLIIWLALFVYGRASWVRSRRVRVKAAT